MNKFSSVLVLCAGLLHAGTALAVEDEIVVTASRLAEPSLDTPESISVLNKERLDLASAVHPSELLNEVAGVNIHRGSAQEHLTSIRSPVLTGGAGAGSFLYLEDGVPLRAAGFSNVNGLFESMIELAGGVEVAKGPGSVLYGSNAQHGLINILSQNPNAAPALSIDVLTNSDQFLRLKASQSAAFMSGRYNVAASFAHDGGFRENSGYDQQKMQLRYDTQLADWSVKSIISLQNLNQETAGFIRGFKAYKDENIAKFNPNPEAYRDGKSARMALHLNKTLDPSSKLSFIPYARRVDLEFRRHFVPGKAIEYSGHKSIGLLSNYHKTVQNHSFTLGIDGEWTKGYVKETQPGPSVFSFIHGAHFDYDVKSSVLSPYARSKISIGPDTSLNLGARLDYTRYDYHNNINSGRFGRFIRIDDRKDEFVTLSPKASLLHSINPNLSAYGRLARGARAPQITDAYSLQLGQQAGEIKAETLDLAEIGFKGRFDALKFNLALFAMRKDNFFFRNANGFNVVNGKTNHKGIELDFDLAVSKKLDLSGALTLADHRYGFNDVVGSPSSTIRKGDQVDSAPHTLGYLQLSVRPNQHTNLSLKWRHVGSYFTDPGNTAKYSGHDVFTLRGFYDFSDQIRLYGRIDNIFDTAYADRADFAFGSHRYFPARPRTLFLGVRYKG